MAGTANVPRRRPPLVVGGTTPRSSFSHPFPLPHPRYKFEPFHQAVRGPGFDFYQVSVCSLPAVTRGRRLSVAVVASPIDPPPLRPQFGNDFVDTLMMTEESATEGIDALEEIDAFVAKVSCQLRLSTLIGSI